VEGADPAEDAAFAEVAQVGDDRETDRVAKEPPAIMTYQFWRPWCLRWGATAEEATKTLPRRRPAGGTGSRLHPRHLDQRPH
jgi:hypothetical protein